MRRSRFTEQQIIAVPAEHEIYPFKARGAAMNALTITNWAMNIFVAVTFLTLGGILGHAGTFWLYGVIAVRAWVFFYLLLLETKGKVSSESKTANGRESLPGIMKGSSVNSTPFEF